MAGSFEFRVSGFEFKVQRDTSLSDGQPETRNPQPKTAFMNFEL
jgi:hypothetical protein